jgi:hypothetical protein
MLRLTSVTILILTLAAACGGGDDGDDASDGDASPTAAATSVAAPTAAATTGSSAVPTTLTSATFAPSVTLTADSDWTVVEDTPGVYVLEHIKNATPEQQAYIVVHKITDVRNPDNFGEAQPLPEDLTGWIAANEHLTVTGGPTPVTIGGIEGSQIDVRTDASYEPTLFGLAGFPVEEGFVVGFRDALRIIELQDVDGGTIIVAAGPLFSQAYFDEVLPVIEPVISSIEFE